MATITMSAAQAIEACENVINNINAEQVKRDEAKINRIMSVKRGIFKKYYFNREQAINYLYKNESDMFSSWRSMYARGHLDHANKLLKLAKHGDPVTLNETDINVLF